ncbi:hypothetical protein BY458DRAFT_587997 [Sporodiniella umbellata]|nr:hypothetical protein BY458DRAFT_587997 [Sporodiniella umbellata]
MSHEVPRWKFRKEKKKERRRSKQKNQEKREVRVEKRESTEDYDQQKARWELEELKHGLIESARLRVQAKEEEARKTAEKKWQETLLGLPVELKEQPKILKTFVRARKSYRERYLESKKSRET